jgi:hypothetical protein
MKTFYVQHESYRGDDLKEVLAFDIYDAAEAYAEEFDTEGDYICVGGEDLHLIVVDEAGVRHGVRVSGYYTPSYSARDDK